MSKAEGQQRVESDRVEQPKSENHRRIEKDQSQNGEHRDNPRQMDN